MSSIASIKDSKYYCRWSNNQSFCLLMILYVDRRREVDCLVVQHYNLSLALHLIVILLNNIDSNLPYKVPILEVIKNQLTPITIDNQYNNNIAISNPIFGTLKCRCFIVHTSTQYGKEQTSLSTECYVPKWIYMYEDRSYLYHHQSNLGVTKPLPAPAARTERGHTTT